MKQLTMSQSGPDQACCGTSIADQVLLVAQALSDPVRIRILAELLAGRSDCCKAPLPPDPDNTEAVCVCDIVSSLGLIQSKVSYHMAKLKETGLVQEEKRGRWNYYTVDRQRAKEFLAACAIFLGVSPENS